MSRSWANVAVTYANDKLKDGAGAQLQRIYGVYALSRFLNVPYVHTPIETLGYHGLPALEANSTSPTLESEYNRIFEIPSDIELPRQRIVHEMQDADAERIIQLQSEGKAAGEFHLVRILMPYPITDRYPELYRHVTAISPFQYSRSNVFRIAIHVRRGELYAIFGERMLPNSFYVDCAMRFQEILKKSDIPFVCELYTEIPSKKFTVTPLHHGIEGRIPSDMTFDPAMNRVEDFDVLPNLHKYINGDPVDTLRRMSTADALIMSRSSFSYVAAILNAHGIVIYHPFWHSPLKDWVMADGDGNFREEDLIARIESWKNGLS